MRHSINPAVRAIMEELQGSTVVPQSNAMATPGGKASIKLKPGAQKAAQGIQQVADQSAQAAGVQAAQNAQQAVDGVRADMAQQQGIDPAQQQQVNKNLAAQPKPARITATAQARGVQGDGIANRKVGQSGVPVQAQESEEAPLPTGAEDVLTNPDESDDYNEDPVEDRAKQRAKEAFPGAKDNKAAGYGKDGAGREQKHREVTNPRQTTAKKSDEKEPEKTEETVFTDAERTRILDEVFNR